MSTLSRFKRVPQIVNRDWQRMMLDIGFNYHSVEPDGTIRPTGPNEFLYWNPSYAYELTAEHVDLLDDATVEVHQMAMAALEDVIRRGDYGRLQIGDIAASLIEKSWKAQDPHLYGRFDVCWDGTGVPKFLEYNADTPTSLLEGAVAQWVWLQDSHPDRDQFNSIHEALIERWKQIANIYRARGREFHRITMLGHGECDEDMGTLGYLMDTAQQAGLYPQFADIDEVIVEHRTGQLFTANKQKITAAFKLYPWEFMAQDDDVRHHLPKTDTQWIEPAWKMVLANKGIWVIMWELFKDHPYLLPTSFHPSDIKGSVVKKPIYSREGANVEIYDEKGFAELITDGSYGKEGHIYQQCHKLPVFDKMHTVLGSWVVGDAAVGMGIREDYGPVTRDTSFYLPHYF